MMQLLLIVSLCLWLGGAWMAAVSEDGCGFELFSCFCGFLFFAATIIQMKGGA